MSAQNLTVPPPRDDDHEDVAWALRAASAQWRREARDDAVTWVQRAAETAHEVGAAERHAELAALAEALGNDGVQAVAPPPPAAALPQIEVSEEEVDIDIEMDDVEMLDDDDDIEMLDDVEEISDADEELVFDEADTGEASVDSEESTAVHVSAPASSPPAPVSSAPPPAPSRRAPAPAPAPLPAAPLRRSAPARPSTSPGGGIIPPSMRAEPSGLELEEEVEEVEEESVEFGELDFQEEAPTSKVSVSSVPPAPELGPLSMNVPTQVPLEQETAAEYAQSRGPQESSHDHDELERELGVNLSVRAAAGDAPAPLDPAGAPSADGPELASKIQPAPEYSPPGADGSLPAALTSPGGEESPIPGRASVRPSQMPGAPDRVTSGDAEPYALAPSAEMPPAAPVPFATPDFVAPPIEPPSRPRTAPPPAAMHDPAEAPSLPPVGAAPLLSSIPPASSVPAPVAAAAPDGDEFDDMFAAISRPPPAPTEQEAHEALPSFEAPAPPSIDSEPPGALHDADLQAAGLRAAEPSAMAVTAGTVVDGVDILEIDGLQDLPEDAAMALAQSAQVMTLAANEEVNSFGVALVTHGSVQMMPTIADAPCATASKGDVLFTHGTLEESAAVRIVGAQDGCRVAVFTKDALNAATSTSPWVADELAEVADRYLGFAGAVLGPLGDSLDDMFRFMVLEKCSVKSKAAGAIIATAGEPLDGMYVLGGGSLELLSEDGAVTGELSMGDFVFPETVLSAGKASQTVRVGAGGALILFANRMAAHELLATCPPFIELLAG